MAKRILIIDSDPSVRELLDLHLAGEEFEFVGVDKGPAALEQLETSAFDLVICEHGTVGLDGFDVVAQIARRFAETPLILTADQAQTDVGSEALAQGAFDALSKPIDISRLKLAIRRIHLNSDLSQKNRLLQRELDRTLIRPPIVGASDSMISLLETLEHAAEFKTTALLTGEVGTQKESMARVIHGQSSRRNRPFVEVDCAAISPLGLASELFGNLGASSRGPSKRRQGLFAQAEAGTLYLGRIESLSHDLQIDVLRALEAEEIWPLGSDKPRPIDVRIIAATDIDLREATRNGHFSVHLFQKLSSITARVPALRDRRDDIPLLVDHVVSEIGRKLGKPQLGISDLSRDRLIEYSWPGNVRELANVMERAATLATGNLVTPNELPREITEGYRNSSSVLGENFSLKHARQELEARVIRRALEATDGNRTHAARLLEISHRALLYKLKDYEIRD